ncbi:sugar transport protein 13 [Tanacetum coccineum]
MGLWYPKDSGFELIAYSDADHAGCKDDCKSTSGGLQSWTSNLCVQTLLDLDTIQSDSDCTEILVYCDSRVPLLFHAIRVQHSKTKHIDIRYHFSKEHVRRYLNIGINIQEKTVKFCGQTRTGERIGLPQKRGGIICAVQDGINFEKPSVLPILFVTCLIENPNKEDGAILESYATILETVVCIVAIPMEAVEAVSTRFANTLYGYFIGKRLAFPLVENYVKNTWAKYGLKRIQLHEDFFMFQFNTKEGMESVMENGPWLIRFVPLILNIWTPNTDLKKDVITSAPLWVKLHHVPIVAYSEVGLSLIATQLDGFTEVKRKNSKAKQNQKNKKVEGVDNIVNPKKHVPKPHAANPLVSELNVSNSFGILEEKEDDNFYDDSRLNDDVLNVSDDEVDEEIEVGRDGNVTSNIPRSHASSSNLHRLCSLVFKHWDWTSNGSWCLKGTRIIMGWNRNDVDVVVINQDDQVIHRVVWPWTIMGDFNASLFLDESTASGSKVDIAMREFRDCVNMIKVFDVQRTGLQFTWNQKPKGGDGLLKKLDRVMANSEFQDHFVGAHAIFKPYRVSDHSPAVLCIPMLSRTCPKPFKFFNILTSHDNFSDVVKDVWDQHICGFHMFCVVKKLKCLKKPLRKLLYEKGNLHANVVRIRADLDSIQASLDVDPFNATLREAEAKCVVEFNQAVLLEERLLKQKAKGVVFQNSSVPDAFVSHYEAFLGCTGETGPFNSVDLFKSRLNEHDALYMVREVSFQEVKDALFSMGDDKSPGPDGFTAAFFKETWSVTGNDVYNAVCEFFRNGTLLKEVNHTIIALLPKVKSPSRINDYRPISCCNVLFKCLSKIIANRIKQCLKHIVSPNQSAFVPGRSITDNILLTQELMHNYHLDRGSPRCAFKVDIQKAYDTVD